MLTFRDVARNIETNAVTSALRAIPQDANLTQSIMRTGSPQNQLAPNHNPDAINGTHILLRASTINIGEGTLAP